MLPLPAEASRYRIPQVTQGYLVPLSAGNNLRMLVYLLHVAGMLQTPARSAYGAPSRNNASMTMPQAATMKPDTTPSLLDAPRWRQPTRTREATAAKQFRADLIRHVGGAPSVPQAALIERIVQLQLHLAVMDRRFAATHTMTEHDSKMYLAWANATARMLAQLGLKGATAPRESLMDKLRRAAASAPERPGWTPPAAPSPQPVHMAGPSPEPAQRPPLAAQSPPSEVAAP